MDPRLTQKAVEATLATRRQRAAHWRIARIGRSFRPGPVSGGGGRAAAAPAS